MTRDTSWLAGRPVGNEWAYVGEALRRHARRQKIGDGERTLKSNG